MHYDDMDNKTVEANKAWASHIDRMDVIGQNGNDGLHYDSEKYPDENCPKHYNTPIQPWAYMESVMSEEAFQGYLEGNIIKYISRWREKGGQQDLKKCKHYLDKLLSVL